jgi:hypothetical protein
MAIALRIEMAPPALRATASLFLALVRGQYQSMTSNAVNLTDG